MANYSELLNDINAAIYENNNQEIDALEVRAILREMVTSLGSGFLFKGIATPSSPGTSQAPDQNVFYLATTAGTYTYLGGLVVAAGEVAFLCYDGTWTKKSTALLSTGSIVDNTTTEDATKPLSAKQGKVLADAGAATAAEVTALGQEVNRIVYTDNANANAVIKRLFIDTSGYTGSYALTGLRLRIIARNVGGQWGIQLGNDQGQTIASPWMTAEKAIQDETLTNGIYIYAEFVWEKMAVGGLPGAPFHLTPYTFSPNNDPRGSVKTNNIADGAITREKLATAQLYFQVFPFVNTNKYFTLLDNEGLANGSLIWPDNAGGSISPKMEIVEQKDSILGVKYARRFTVLDILYQGSYYANPYQTGYFNKLRGATDISVGFWSKREAGKTYPTDLGFGISGFDKILPFNQVDGVENTQTYTSAGHYAFSMTTKRSKPYTFNGDTWYFYTAYVHFTDTTDVPATDPRVVIRVRGGADYKETSCDLIGLYIIPLKLPDEYPPFALYPYDSSFYEKFLLGSAPLPFSDMVYGAAGDSITAGAGLNDTLPADDAFRPITGTAKATYAYWIAKKNNAKWYNYGLSGSTLGDVNCGGVDNVGFSKSSGRYTQMANDLTHISIFFGWNDAAYGKQMKKQEYATATWGGGNTLLYPRNSSQYDKIGTAGWVTQAQFDEIEAMTGSVGGVSYDNSTDYWNAVYAGTSADNTNKTFWGAWNIVLPYLINKYPLAKILLVVPYGTNPMLRQAVRDAAYKYGLEYYDFDKAGEQMFFGYLDEATQPAGVVNGSSIHNFRRANLLADGTHPNEDGYKYLWPSINAKLTAL